MRFHRWILAKNVYVADTVYRIGFELIVFGVAVKPVLMITTSKGHIHK